MSRRSYAMLHFFGYCQKHYTIQLIFDFSFLEKRNIIAPVTWDIDLNMRALLSGSRLLCLTLLTIFTLTVSEVQSAPRPQHEIILPSSPPIQARRRSTVSSTQEDTNNSDMFTSTTPPNTSFLAAYPPRRELFTYDFPASTANMTILLNTIAHITTKEAQQCLAGALSLASSADGNSLVSSIFTFPENVTVEQLTFGIRPDPSTQLLTYGNMVAIITTFQQWLSAQEVYSGLLFYLEDSTVGPLGDGIFDFWKQPVSRLTS